MGRESNLVVGMLAGSAIPVTCSVGLILSTVGVNVQVAHVTNTVALVSRVRIYGRQNLRAAGKCVPMSEIVTRPLYSGGMIVIVVAANGANRGATRVFMGCLVSLLHIVFGTVC